MRKGQTLRILFTESSTDKVVALSKSLNFHLSVQTEEDTTKDDSSNADSNGVVWITNSGLAIAGDIQVEGLYGIGTDTAAMSPRDIIAAITNTVKTWKLAIVSGTGNRTVSELICSGSCKLTNIKITAQVGQKVSFTASANTYGTITVPAEV